MDSYRSVVVEADGGSRGNPGNAAYGAVLKDAGSGEVIAERAERIGVASNNVAEYRGLVAGLELYRQYADGADLEVRMDSKLVVEQMSGRWKIKHPDMAALAQEAGRIAPAGARYTWVPREQNKDADRLANEALDGPEGVLIDRAPARTEPREPAGESRPLPKPPWEQGPPTTFVLMRHGETPHTRERRFAGRDGADPGLSDDGRAQVEATARWLADLEAHDPVLLTSPMRRTRESADILAARLGADPVVDEGLLEASFGRWEGLRFGDVMAQEPDLIRRWFEDVDVPAGGHGDSMAAFDARMRETAARLLSAYTGRTVVASTHMTPIKTMAAQVLQMPLSGLTRAEIAPASVTVLSWYPDGRPVVRLLNGRPHGGAFLAH